MKTLITSLILTSALAFPTASFATEFCAKLKDKDSLPAKYAKKGPFYTDRETGWIVGTDQLKSKFEVSKEARVLWSAIAAAFEKKGAQLVVLAAPPRPLFAPKSALPTSFDPAATTHAFSSYIDELNAAGILAPDLSTLQTSQNADEIYFARDTHWTPKGAAVSVAELAHTVLGQAPSDVLKNVEFTQKYEEKGSLSTVVEKTCGHRPEAEVVDMANYQTKSGSLGLLEESTGPSIALVGTSFSNRYKRDALGVADALSHSFGLPVENFAVTGGGLVGAMEAFVRSEAFETGQFKFVVWETPYTAPLTDLSGLRQVLGAIQQGGPVQTAGSAMLSKDWVKLDASFDARQFQTIQFTTPSQNTGKLEVEMYDKDGTKLRFKLNKTKRVDVSARSEIWSLALHDLPISQVARMKLRSSEASVSVQVSLLK